MRDDLIDPDLFGNEAGEDEDSEILNSYFQKKPEYDRFYSTSRRLAFVRSRKGMGKSTLLKQTQYEREKANPQDIIFFIKASEFYAQDMSGMSSAELVYTWQQRICTRINIELGARMKWGRSDDSIYLVEKAELSGFRGRNIISALFDRLSIKLEGAEVARTRLEPASSQAVTARVLASGEAQVWILIDDIDATFLNTEEERTRISTFFSACRNMITSVQGLHIRASVRTDVWWILAQHDEALDKCEQYMLDLKWSTEETGRILEAKIKSYFTRRYPGVALYSDLKLGSHASAIRRLVFREPFPWGQRKLDAFRPIHILSGGRPRWATQICRLAGVEAYNKSFDKIAMGHVRDVLREYGALRVSDLYKEHRHQCARLSEIVESFSGGPANYTTEQLLDHIFDKIVKEHGLPKIDGIPAVAGGLSVAHFLFRIGFIAARDENDPTGLNFLRYEDRPNLLTTKVNLDDGLSWEIHPSYRNVLRIGNGRTAAQKASVP